VHVRALVGGLCLAAGIAAFAQGSGEVAYFHLNRVKPGMTAQYEATRKRHWLWHKRLGDTWSFQVWQVVSGDRTGAYIVSSFGHTWKEVDESDKLVAGDEDPGANVDPYIASESESYYRYLPDLSLAPQTFSPAPMLSVTRFVLKPEEISTFQYGLKNIKDAMKSGYPLAGPMRWYQLATGGEGPQFLLLSDRANWADYEPRSPKTLDATMEEAYGKEQGAAILRAVRGAVRSEYVETWKYRSDLSFVPATSGSAQTAVPVDEEPHHHVLLKNDFVEVIRATLQPGESTLFHTHAHDIARFSLAASTTTEQLLGKPEQPASTSRVGEVYAESVSNRPYTHRIHNVGNGLMDEFAVVLLQGPTQPSTHAAAPVAAENASARVYNWVLAPGTVAAMHTHQRPYLIVAVTPPHLKLISRDGQSLAEAVKPGDFHWVNAKVTHALANEGTAEGQIVEIEMK